MNDVIFILITWAVSGTIMGWLAKRKNRNMWAWGIVGGILFLPALLIMMFMNYLCPHCKNPITNQEWKEKKCPRCNLEFIEDSLKVK